MPADRLPVVLLTGFLGSGKTTLLNRLLREPAMRGTAVLVNEFGEVGLDHLLIQQASGEVVLLENGCICCTVREGLSAGLLALLGQRDRGSVPAFERVVIETTGLADPFPIIRVLGEDPMLAARLELTQVVTVCDAAAPSAGFEVMPEAMAQIAAADCLWLSKCDLAPASQRDAAARHARSINAGATVLRAAAAGDFDTLAGACSAGPGVAGFAARRAWGGLVGSRHGISCVCCRPAAALARTDHGAVRSFCIVRDEPMSWSVIGPWLEVLLQMCGDRLLRMKGMLCVSGDADRPWIVHAVQGHLGPPEQLPGWPTDDRSSRLIMIGRDLDRDAIEQALSAFEA